MGSDPMATERTLAKVLITRVNYPEDLFRNPIHKLKPWQFVLYWHEQGLLAQAEIVL